MKLLIKNKECIENNKEQIDVIGKLIPLLRRRGDSGDSDKIDEYEMEIAELKNFLIFRNRFNSECLNKT